MIHIEGLTKAYGEQVAVSDVTMHIKTGTITVIVGRSGSGKSTLLRLVNRLIEPCQGTVAIGGVDTREIPTHELRRRIGYVIQDNGLFPHWTVNRNVATVPSLLGWGSDVIQERVHELLTLLQLDPNEIGQRYPHQLSGGQAQRVGVARALAARPDILLMDEPFGALDPVIRAKAQIDLKDIQHKLRPTILLVTHDMTEAIRLGDQIAVMNEGKVEQFAMPTDILASPRSGFVRDLVGETDRPFHYLSLLKVADYVHEGSGEGKPIRWDQSLLDVLSEMLWSGRDIIPVLDTKGTQMGCISRGALLAQARGPS